MLSPVSPNVEETCFRCYWLQILGVDVIASNNCCDFVLTFHVGHEHHGWFWPRLLVYFLAGIAFAATAYLTTSILAGIPVHIAADAVFFTLVWPHDATRRLLTEGGADTWFWIHVAQAAIFTALALFAFRSLANHSAGKPRVVKAAKFRVA
jgi:hypothetical protein